MDNASNQAYIYKEMYASFHPAKDAKPVSHPFEVPDDWTYTRFDMGSFYMEKLVNPKARRTGPSSSFMAADTPRPSMLNTEGSACVSLSFPMRGTPTW